MNPIQNFAFNEHLVRAVDIEGEPWFVGKDVCSVLDIQKHHQALDNLDEDERGTYSIGTPRGDQSMIVISEPGVYRLVFRSRKPEAEAFKRWLAHEVLPQLRHTGVYALAKEVPVLASIAQDAPLAARIDAVRLARSLFGSERARALWQELGLPHVPPPSPFHGFGEAAECLRLLLDHEAAPGRKVRDLVLVASQGGMEELALLRMEGIRVSEDADGFWVSNTMPAILRIFADSPWAANWTLVLRRLEGAMPGERQTFGGQTRTTWLPLAVLDDEVLRGL